MGAYLLSLSVVLPVWLEAVPMAPTAGGEAHRAGRALRLDDAIEAGLRSHPTAKQAHAQTTAAEARADEAKAPYLPQLSAVASYQRVRRANFAGTGLISGTTNVGTGTTGTGTAPGAAPTTTITAATDPSGVDVFTFGGSATQLIWDFGKTSESYKAANRLVLAAEAQEKVTAQSIVVAVRRTYFTARTQKALVGVAQESLVNLERHLFQISEFVSAGVRPEIDLAQARTDLANGRAALIDAENAYGIAKAQLGQAMGDFSGTDFDVVDDDMPAIDGEDLPPETLFAKAVAARPELALFQRRVDAQTRTVSAVKGTYYPSLAASAGASETGTALSALGPAWNVGIGVTWPILEGGLRRAQVREAEANVQSAEADLAVERLQIRVDVHQAALNIRAAKATQSAAEDAATNARERLRLAEGRYLSGLGNAIELSDSQLAMTTAQSQLVQAKIRLSTARADLLSALGRR
jgi:outer membrane protein